MIEDKVVAKKISKLMIEYSSKLNESIIIVKDKCSDKEFEIFRKAVSYVLGEMLIRIMNPLYQQHPELKPEDLYVPGVSPKKEKNFKEMLERYKSGDKKIFNNIKK